MAKRELIAKSGVINVIMALEQSCDDRQDFYIESTTELDAGIDSIPTFTEQDIVKPYLEKLKADIEAAYDELDGYDPDALGTFASRIDDLIDNLLSESEG